jgi:hypothetical protein
MQRGHTQPGWCKTCAAQYEQRSTMTDTTLWLEVAGRWERVPLREVRLPKRLRILVRTLGLP